MNHPAPQTTPLGKVIDAALDSIGLHTDRQREEATGIPRTTFNRKVMRGGFTDVDLTAIADLLGTTASDLMARAEQVAA